MTRTIKVFGFIFVLFFSFSLFSINSVSYCVKSPSLVFSGETYNVNITINKNRISGSSKFEVIVPNGFIVEPVVTSGANFIFKDNKAKFIWLILPTTDDVVISYNISVPDSYKGEKKIFRKFFYIDGNRIHEEGFYSKVNVVENDLLVNIKNTEKAFRDNITFKIQIGAFINKVTPRKISNKAVDNYKIEEEFTGYYYKYSIGEFSSLETVTKVKESLDIKGSFIIAYNNNKRITIEEAVSKLKGY